METKKARFDLLPFDYVELLSKLTKFQDDGYELMSVNKSRFSFEKTQKKINYLISFVEEKKDSWELIGLTQNCMYIYKSSECTPSKEDYQEIKKSLAQTTQVKKTRTQYIVALVLLVIFAVLIVILDFKPVLKVLLMIIIGITLVSVLYLIYLINGFQKGKVNPKSKSSYPIYGIYLAALLAMIAFLIMLFS